MCRRGIIQHVKEDAIHAGPCLEGRWVHRGPRRAAAAAAACCSRWVSVGFGWFLGFFVGFSAPACLLCLLCLLPAWEYYGSAAGLWWGVTRPVLIPKNALGCVASMDGWGEARSLFRCEPSYPVHNGLVPQKPWPRWMVSGSSALEAHHDGDPEPPAGALARVSDTCQPDTSGGTEPGSAGRRTATGRPRAALGMDDDGSRALGDQSPM